MNVYRAKHDNVPESPVRTLYGRKGNLLLMPLDVCILQFVGGKEEFRPSSDTTRLIAAPIQDEIDGRIGTIAQYGWPPLNCAAAVDPVVLVQIAPSASLKGVEDLRLIAAQVEVGDAVICGEDGVEGTVTRAIGWCIYPDLTHKVEAYRVEFGKPVARRAHGSVVRLKSGELVGMLIATQNQASGVCRALVYPT